ncbi:phospholipase D family protein [Aquihabitans sp. McL0605]|uniref:phospholipase D family protein n=1 Tax=Aquihabitans sp. McL0605 TaxID=3415671 RepID=UPI003CEFC376
MRLDDWFLTPEERANPATEIDRRRAPPAAWSVGNDVTVWLDGAGYFGHLEQVLVDLDEASTVWFTDWDGNADERLSGSGSEVGPLLTRLAERGVQICGLLWRSHPRQAQFSEQDNMALVREVNRRGGLLALDERVRRGGCHHQKLVVIRRPARLGPDLAFVGGIDLCHGRHDDADHLGDPQAVRLSDRYGARPPWHDVHLAVEGPAVDDVAWSFAERWNDPARLDHRNPVRAFLRWRNHQPRRLPPVEVPIGSPSTTGTSAVQVLRTYPSRRPRYPFAPDGERSVARAYLKAIGRARSLVVLEDQYFWSVEMARALAKALRGNPSLRLVIVVPRHPDQDGAVTGNVSRMARERALAIVTAAGGDRVAVFDLENRLGTPIYVHAKVCIIDDVWMEIGSDNLNRRSWTHDSEIGCAVIDERRDDREPTDPGGRGDGARVLARETRLRLWCEHLGRVGGDDHDIVDPQQAFEVLRASARRLDAWAAAPAPRGERPAGHLRPHRLQAVPWWGRPFLAIVYRLFVDPDGRPLRLRRSRTY